MRSRPTTDHQDAVARRLALLSAELAGTRPEPWPAGPGDAELDPHSEVEAEADETPYVMAPTHTRVRAPRRDVPDVLEEPEAPDLVADEPAPVPRPGRHAARRLGRSVSGVVPETMRGRVALGPSQLALVAVLVAVGLALTTWGVVRGDPRQVAAPVAAQPVPGLATPAPGPGPAPGATPVASGSATATTGEQVTVDVAGKVRRPGIVVLDAGSRVVDAIEAAGGARPRVDLTGLNLARVLVDGEQVLVGLPAPVGTGVTGSSPPTAGALVNLNAATAAELESLPEVGPVTAAAILAWRDEHGGFTAVEELLEVDGIGDATLATIAPHVTV